MGSQYADDTSLILQSDGAIKASFEVYSLFEKASDSKLNQSKSKGLWLGGRSGRTDLPVPLDWSSVKIKALGMFVGVGDLEEDNWRPRITLVDNVLKSWPACSLSFQGKSLVINALALSRIWYVASPFGGNVSLANYLSDFKSTFSLVDNWRKLHPRSCQVS